MLGHKKTVCHTVRAKEDRKSHVHLIVTFIPKGYSWTSTNRHEKHRFATLGCTTLSVPLVTRQKITSPMPKCSTRYSVLAPKWSLTFLWTARQNTTTSITIPTRRGQFLCLLLSFFCLVSKSLSEKGEIWQTKMWMNSGNSRKPFRTIACLTYRCATVDREVNKKTQLTHFPLNSWQSYKMSNRFKFFAFINIVILDKKRREI